MKFIDDVKAYKESKENAIQDKKDLLKQLEKDYDNKSLEIKKTESDYRNTFDDKTFDKLTKLKLDLQDIEKNISKTKDKLSLMDIGEMDLSADDVEKQLNDYIKSLHLEKIRQDIILKKSEYINSINAFIEALDKICVERREINNIQMYITKDTKDVIKNTLNQLNKLSWGQEFNVKQPGVIPADKNNYYITIIDKLEKEVNSKNQSIRASFWED